MKNQTLYEIPKNFNLVLGPITSCYVKKLYV